MLCKDAMKTDVERVRPEVSALFAARMMRRANVCFLPVCDERATVLGTLSDRDLTVRLLADGLPIETPVSVVMRRDVLTCHPSHEIAVAQHLMALRRESRILCVDSDSRLLGTIDLADLAALEGGDASAIPRWGKVPLGSTVVDAAGKKLGTVTRHAKGCFLVQKNGFSKDSQWVLEDQVVRSSHGRVQLAAASPACPPVEAVAAARERGITAGIFR